MPKRQISPHKGGRTERSGEGRVTPEEKAALYAERDRLGLSVADWLALMIEQSRRIQPEDAQAWLEKYHEI